MLANEKSGLYHFGGTEIGRFSYWRWHLVEIELAQNVFEFQEQSRIDIQEHRRPIFIEEFIYADGIGWNSSIQIFIH